MSNRILVVDIETTGFLNQGGQIVEIGMVLLNLDNGEVEPIYESLIREPGFNWNHTTGRFGWIFQNSDLTPEEVFDAPSLESQREAIQFLFDHHRATAFNKKFDFDFLRDRGFRIEELPCPMMVATPIIKLPSRNGYNSYKWPKVEEAWEYFFGDTGYIESHRGMDDAEHEAKIVYALYRMGAFVV